MRNELNTIEKIEAFLHGKLSREESEKFQNEIDKNPELRKQIEIQDLLQKAIVRKAIKKDVIKYGGGKSFLFLKGLGLIISILIVAGLTYYFSSNESAGSKYSKELSKNLKIEQSNGRVEVDLTKNKIPSQEQVVKEPTKVNGPKHSTQNESCGGLKTWIDPNLQVYDVDPKKGATIEGEEGTLLVIPENAFEDQNGNLITEPFEIKMIEALKVSDMIAYNLTTMSGKNPLSSGGMVFLEPVNKSDSIRLRRDRPIYMEIPTDKYNPNMKSWDGVVDKAGNIDWQNPKDLDKYLIPVDFDLLDFIPDGFDEAVAAGLPFQGHEELSKKLVDTLYYSLNLFSQRNDSDVEVADISYIPPIDTTERDRKRASRVFERMGFIGGFGKRSENDTPKTDNDKIGNKERKTSNEICHIDPLSIKTIQQPKFSNTYLATKEFEQRLKALHKIPYGQKYFDIYLSNLTEALWKSDEKVADLLEGENKLLFQKFAAQKLTNVKDAPLYMERLKEYYNSKREEFKKKQIDAHNKYKSKRQEDLQTLTKKLEKSIQEYNNAAQINRTVGGKPSRETENPFPSPISNSSVTNVATSQNTYATSWFGFGWKNIDAYLKLIDDNSREVEILAKNTKAKVYQCINTLNTIVPLNLINERAIAKFPNKNRPESKEMRNTYAIGLYRNSADVLFYSEKEYNPYTLNEISLDFIAIESKELYSKLRRLDGDNSPLIKKMKEEQNQIEKRQRILAKKKELMGQIKKEQVALKELQETQRKEREYILTLWNVLDHCPEEFRSKKTMTKKM